MSTSGMSYDHAFDVRAIYLYVDVREVFIIDAIAFLRMCSLSNSWHLCYHKWSAGAGFHMDENLRYIQNHKDDSDEFKCC